MDTVSKEKRSWTMSQVKSSGNKSTEQKLVLFFKKFRITGWRRNYPLFGKPDFVFPKKKTAVFVDGSFWHGHPQYCRIPKTNKSYWLKKISRNQERDKEVNEVLSSKGWKVVRIWDFELKDEALIKRLLKTL